MVLHVSPTLSSTAHVGPFFAYVRTRAIAVGDTVRFCRSRESERVMWGGRHTDRVTDALLDA